MDNFDEFLDQYESADNNQTDEFDSYLDETAQESNNKQEKKKKLSAPSARSFVKSNTALDALLGLGELLTAVPRIAGDVVIDQMTTDEPLMDSLGFSYNHRVAQPLRDQLGINDKVQNKGAFFQPDTVKRNGKTYMTGNKNFNDLSDEELQYIAQEKEDKDANQALYILEQRRKGIIKPGYSGSDGAWGRWGKDHDFPNWEVKQEVYSEDAKTLERLFHGSKNALQRRRYDLGQEHDNAGLSSSYTEMQNMPNDMLFGKTTTNTDPTPTQQKAVKEIEKVLTPEQVQLTQQIRDKTIAKKSTMLENYEKLRPLKAKDLNGMTMGQMIKTIAEKEKNRGGGLSARGGISDEELYKTQQWTKLVNDLAPEFSDINQNMSQEEKNKLMGELLSTFDWNLYAKGRMALAKKTPKVARALDTARKLYQMTDLTSNQVKTGLKGVATDPTNLLGLGVLSKFLGKGATAAKIGAVEGASYAGADDALSQSIEMEANKDQDFDFSRGLIAATMGATLGGTLGKIMGSIPKKDMDVAKDLINKAPTEKAKIEVAKRIEKVFKEKGYLEQYKDFATTTTKEVESTPIPVQKNAAKVIEKVSEQNTAVNHEIAKELEKVEQGPIPHTVQEEQKVYVGKLDNEDKPIVEVVNPIKGQEEIVPNNLPKRPNKKKEIVMIEKGDAKRGYQEDGYLQSHQGGKGGFSQTKRADLTIDPKSVKSIDKYISEKVKMFQEKEKMLTRYGRNEAKLDKNAKKPDYTIEEKLARRMRYEFNEIRKLLKRKDLSQDVHAQLQKRLADIGNHAQKIKHKGVLTKELSKKIKDFEQSQYKPKYDYDNTARKTEMSDRYGFLKEAGKLNKKDKGYSDWSAKMQHSPFGKATGARRKKYERNLFRSMVDEKNALEKRVGKLEDKIQRQLIAKGIQDDLSVLPERGVDMDAVREIQRFRDLNDDIYDLTNGKISMEEALFRQLEHMDTKIEDKVSQYIKEGLSPEKAVQKASLEYRRLGVKTKRSVVVAKNKAEIPRRFQRVGKDKYKFGEHTITKRQDEKYQLQGKEINEVHDTIKSAKQRSEELYQLEKQQKDAKKQLWKEQAEVKFQKENKAGREEQFKKFKAYVDRNFVQIRRTATNKGRAGHETVTKRQEEYLDAGITPRELADMQYPPEATMDTIDYWKKVKKEQINTKLNDLTRKKLGIPSQRRFLENPAKLHFSEQMIDASNSMLQMMSVLTGSENFGKFAKLTGTDIDVRKVLGKVMEEDFGFKLPKVLNSEGKQASWKDIIKPLFMTENYGQGEKGLVNTLINDFKMKPKDAKTFFDGYQKAMDKVFPEIKTFRNIINERMKYPELGDTISWTLPDGSKVTAKLSKEVNGTFQMRSQNGEINIKTNDLDTFSRALMPAYIQSYDAWVAKKMRDLGYLTNHDAFIPPKGKTIQQMQDDYGNLLAEIMESGVFEKNVEEMLGGKEAMEKHGIMVGKPKQGTLTRDQIMSSEHKMEMEHQPSEPESRAAREIENDKWKTEEELMRDFMASSNYRNISTHSITDAIVDNIGRNDEFAKIVKNQDPFERQAALAAQSEKYNPDLSIPAPKGVDEKVWNKTQRDIFFESRAKLEQNPNVNDLIKGQRIFFQKNGKPIGDKRLTRKEVESMFREEDFKTRQEYNKMVRDEIKRLRENNRRIQQRIVDLENKKGKATFDNFRSAEKKLIQQIGNDYISVAKRVKSWNPKKKLNEAETFAQQVVENSRIPERTPGLISSLVDKIKTSTWYPYFARQVVTNDIALKQLQDLHVVAKKYGNISGRYEEALTKVIEKDIPKEVRKEWYQHLLKTDYAAIRGMTKKEAEKFFSDYNDVYKKAKKYIDRAAKGLGQASEQYGFYTNNPLGIARRTNMPDEAADIIDKLISIRAMTDDAWKFTERMSKDKGFNRTLDRIQANQRLSKTLFEENPESYIKGYVSEVYNPNMEIGPDGRVRYKTDSATQGALGVDIQHKKRGKRLDKMTNEQLTESIMNMSKEIQELERVIAEDKGARLRLKNKTLADNRGKILELESKKKLTPKQKEILESLKKTEAIEVQKMKMRGFSEETINDMIDKAPVKTDLEKEILSMTKEKKQMLIEMIKQLDEESNYGVSLNRLIDEGKLDAAEMRRLKLTEKDVRAIAGDEIREQLGHEEDIVKALVKTVSETEIKIGHNNKNAEILKGSFDELFSAQPKDGFVKVSKDHMTTMPYELKDHVKYVRKEFYDQIIGRKDPQLINSEKQYLRIIDRLLKDATTRFKKNNVLSNTASHVNAFAYNQAVGMSLGITPEKMAKHQIKATQEMREIVKIMERIADLASRGKDFSRLQKKLNNNMLFQLEQNGLATNVVDGINQAPDLWRQITADLFDKHVKPGSKTSDATKKIAGNVFAEGDSEIGKVFTASFSFIDTQGRYMTALHYMSKEGGNLPMKEAIVKANGLFADMDQMAPKLIEILDKYPLMPFIKWATGVIPMTAKMVKENPVKAIAVAAMLYVLMKESKDENSRGGSGIRTTGWNPILSNIDFVPDQIEAILEDLPNDIKRDTSWGEKIFRRMGKYIAPSFITKPADQYFVRNKGLGDIARGFVISNSDKDYKDIKGAQLRTKGKSADFIDPIFYTEDVVK